MPSVLYGIFLRINKLQIVEGLLNSVCTWGGMELEEEIGCSVFSLINTWTVYGLAR